MKDEIEILVREVLFEKAPFVVQTIAGEKYMVRHGKIQDMNSEHNLKPDTKEIYLRDGFYVVTEGLYESYLLLKSNTIQNKK